MNRALTTIPNADEQPRGITESSIAKTGEQLRLLTKLVTDVLRKDEDYGVIPGTGQKSTLLKPGAANVTAAFNCHAEPAIDTQTVDPTMGAYGFVSYEVHVDLVSNLTGNVMARGFGAANSHEKKYRWRDAKPKCPKCEQETVLRSKEGGFFCWRKIGGCGESFHHDDKAITSQKVGRVENEDPLDLANTLKKMAIKRAEVDAAMRLPGVARFFTQDMEDIAGELAERPTSEAPTNAPRGQPAPTHPAAPTAPKEPAAAPDRGPGDDSETEPETAGQLFDWLANLDGLSRAQAMQALNHLSKGTIQASTASVEAYGPGAAYRLYRKSYPREEAAVEARSRQGHSS